MKIVKQYYNQEERLRIIADHSELFLIEEQNISTGNFLVFSDVLIEKEIVTVYKNVPEEEFNALKTGTELLESQNQAISERSDFIEDTIAEMAMIVYQ